MIHTCNGANRHTAIPQAIIGATDGDTLLVVSDTAAVLARGTRDRMRPGLRLIFKVRQPAVRYTDYEIRDALRRKVNRR